MAAPSPLGCAPFRWLLTGRVVNSLGNSVAPIALAFAVIDLTRSASDLGIVVGARSVANVLLLLFGGVLADRLPRGLVLVGSCVAAAVTQGCVAALILTGQAQIWSLAALGFVNGAVAALSFPASAALTPSTVPAELFQRASAITRIGLNLTNVLAISLGGVLVATVGPGWGIAVDAGSFALAGLAFTRVHVDHVAKQDETTMLADLREGWSEFISRTWVWVVVLQFCVVNAALSGAEGVLGPVVADRTIGRGLYGVVLAASTLGLIIGAVFALKMTTRRPLLLGVAAMLLSVLPALGLGIAPNLAVLVPCFLIAALGTDVFGVAWDTSLAQNVPADKLARVYSYDALGSLVAIPVGEVAVGPVAQIIGVRSTLIGCATAILGATLLALASRSVLNLERSEVPR